MLALDPLIKHRLAALPALTGWKTRSFFDLEDRSEQPAVSVRCPGANLGKPSTRGAMVLPVWRITLTVDRKAGTAPLDAAIEAVIGSLHGWRPEVGAGQRGWEPLQLDGITEPEVLDGGLLGYQLSFSTGGLYQGQP